MRPRPTLRRSGRHHVTIRVRFDPDADVAVDALALWADEEHADDVLAGVRASKALVHELLVTGYRNHGDGFPVWCADNLSDMDDAAALRDWATAELRRLWPEWW